MFTTLSRILHTGILTEPQPAPPADTTPIPDALHQRLWAVLGRALTIRHGDAGSCNGCELEIHALNNPYYNLEGAGIKFVASPRHADMLLVTGPVSVNMEEALLRTYDAMPTPKLVVALGDCAHCGGVFGGSIATPNYAIRGSIARVLPVDHTIRGCPPTPAAILAGILQAISTHTPSPSASDKR
jgi:Ni,Fe-hydrogenase III small subunit